MKIRSILWSGTIVTFTLVTTGCYQFTSTPLAQAPVGEEVRVTLAESAQVPLGEVNVRDAMLLQGRLIRMEGDRVELFVSRVENRNGNVFTGGGDVFTTDQARISMIESRTLQKGKTVGLAVGLTAAFIGTFLAVFGRENKSGETGTDPGPRPLIRIPVSIPIG